MKAFIAAIAAMILIAYGASCYLGTLGYSSSDKYQMDDVRLGQ